MESNYTFYAAPSGAGRLPPYCCYKDLAPTEPALASIESRLQANHVFRLPAREPWEIV
jgi:hypothetical protein